MSFERLIFINLRTLSRGISPLIFSKSLKNSQQNTHSFYNEAAELQPTIVLCKCFLGSSSFFMFGQSHY